MKITLKELEYLVSNGHTPEIDSPSGKVRITDTYRKFGSGLRLRLNNGEEIVCSEEHLIFSGDEWIPAKNIEFGLNINGVTITSIEKVPPQSWVDFTVEANHHSYYHAGLTHHNSGKSQIIYLLTRFLIENVEGDILIVVPTTSLTTQLKGDFESYVNDDFIVGDFVSLLGGTSKAEQKRVLISTWQSLIRQSYNFFERFSGGALIVDECHLAKSKSITSIVYKLPRTKFKFGFTGTVADAKCSELQLKGLFGPIYKTKTTKKLQEEGVLSALEIEVVKLKYPKVERDGFWSLSPDYKKEVDWLSRHPSRNEYIANLAVQQTPRNTLILYNFISHGQTLYEKIKGKLGDSHVFLVNGNTPPSERERIRVFTESEKGVIIIASSALFSTGVNIRNLSTLIFAHSFKAKIRNLQSIGRSLRVHKDKDKAVLYDITDDLSKKGKNNTTLRHMVERVKIYQRENFDYKLNEVELDELYIL